MKIVGYLSGDAISRDRERMEEHAARFGKPYPHELVIKADAEAALQAAVAAERSIWRRAVEDQCFRDRAVQIIATADGYRTQENIRARGGAAHE